MKSREAAREILFYLTFNHIFDNFSIFCLILNDSFFLSDTPFRDIFYSFTYYVVYPVRFCILEVSYEWHENPRFDDCESFGYIFQLLSILDNRKTRFRQFQSNIQLDMQYAVRVSRLDKYE